MKKILLSFLISLNVLIGYSQNLVPNGDFEAYNFCPGVIGSLYQATGWNSPLNPSTPDYFNSCAVLTSWVSVPKNYFGYQMARSGQGYAGLISAHQSNNPLFHGYREYIQSQLIQPLIAGEEYFLQLYVSLCDSCQYSTNEFGIYFSTIPVQDSCPTIIPCNLTYVPQIENSNSNSLFDRVNWIQISGTYSAIGGEEYLVFGNFKDSLNTPILATGWAPNWQRYFAYFYIDDVCLSSDSLYCPSLTNLSNTNSNNTLSVYPNPANTQIKISLPNSNAFDLEVYDMAGKLVYKNHEQPGKNEVVISTIDFADGLYMLRYVQGVHSRCSKFAIQH